MSTINEGTNSKIPKYARVIYNNRQLPESCAAMATANTFVRQFYQAVENTDLSSERHRWWSIISTNHSL